MDMSNEHFSYIVGFLHGDGHYHVQSRNRGRIAVELSLRDIDILDKMENVFNDLGIKVKRSNDIITDTNFKKDFHSCELRIFDKKTREFLNIPAGKKSHIIKPPDGVIISHYIRGLFDADGSIGISSLNRPFWSLCTSSEKIKELVVKDIHDKTGLEKRLNRNKRDNVYNIVIYDEDAVIYSKMLYDAATIYLDRKYNKFCEIQQWQRVLPKIKSRRKAWLSSEDEIACSSLILKEKMTLLNRSDNSIKTRIWRLKQ